MTRPSLITGLVAAAFGCSANPHREPPVSDVTAGVTEEMAMRYEHGDGVPRDYTRATRIHEELCADGKGEPVACRRFVSNHVQHRGEPKNPRINPIALLTLACSRGDWLSCGRYIPFDVAAAQVACDHDQPAACLAVNVTHFMSQSGTLEFEDGERRERACHGGVLEACVEIVTIASYYDDGEGKEAAPDVLAVVIRACDRGDADACKALERPIDPAALCRANDFGACAEAGASDPAALGKACAHDVPEACEGVALAARDADPPDPNVAQHFERACKLGSDTACRQNRPADLAIGCAAYQPTRVPAAKRRPLPRLGGTVAGATWSAPAGQPFVVLRYDYRDGPPARYGEIARHLGADVGVYVLVDGDAVASELAPSIAVVLDPALADEPLTAESKPGVGSPLGLHLRNGWPTIVDASGVPRAILSTEWGIQPVTLARCARGILTER